MREVSEVLGSWTSFYVMIGSSAATLTGLMFVVISLVKDEDGPSEDGVSTFSTPTVYHFCCALFVAAVMSAPFRSFLPVAIALGLAGGTGLVYIISLVSRASRLATYRPDSEDWAWYTVIPGVAYALIAVGAICLIRSPSSALFAPAAGVTLLIFLGIHNSWDVVTYLAVGRGGPEPKPDDDKGPPEGVAGPGPGAGGHA